MNVSDTHEFFSCNYHIQASNRVYRCHFMHPCSQQNRSDTRGVWVSVTSRTSATGYSIGLPTPRLVLNKKLHLHSQFLTVSTIRYPTCAGIQTLFVWTRWGLRCPVAQATVARVERERGRSLSMAGTARLTDRDEHRGHRWSDQTVDDRDTTSSTTF